MTSTAHRSHARSAKALGFFGEHIEERLKTDAAPNL